MLVLLGPRNPPPRVMGAWLVVLGLTTGALWSLRPALDKAHMAMGFLLLVLLGSARHGARLGLLLAVLAFLCFNFFLLPPYYTFHLANPLDWVVLLTFLATSAVAAHLFEQKRRETDVAHRRATEIDRLAALGATAINAVRPEDAVLAIARVVQTTLGVAQCEIHQWELQSGSHQLLARAGQEPTGKDAAPGLIEYVAREATVAIETAAGSTHLPHDAGAELKQLEGQDGARAVLVPLRIRDHTVGVLRLADPARITLSTEQAEFLATLAYYAALGVERVQLIQEEHRAHSLEELNRLKDALLAAVSHDLRTPLTTIKALAHEMASGGDERAAAISEEAERLNHMVSGLLDLSSLEAGTLPLQPEIVPAEDLVGAALQRVAGLQGNRQITVRLPSTPEFAAGRFDFAQSLRILTNLLDNALKYGPRGQPIEIDVRQDGAWFTLEVLDRGPGVSPDDVDRLFLPFHRLSTAPDVGGTGLGLAIARRLAEAQGGSLEYRPRPGGGSIFRLRLPAVTLADLKPAGAEPQPR